MRAPVKTYICLRIRAVWLEPSLSARTDFAPLIIQNELSEDSDQTAQTRSVIRDFASCISAGTFSDIAAQVLKVIGFKKKKKKKKKNMLSEPS